MYNEIIWNCIIVKQGDPISGCKPSPYRKHVITKIGKQICFWHARQISNRYHGNSCTPIVLKLLYLFQTGFRVKQKKVCANRTKIDKFYLLRSNVKVVEVSGSQVFRPISLVYIAWGIQYKNIWYQSKLSTTICFGLFIDLDLFLDLESPWLSSWRVFLEQIL